MAIWLLFIVICIYSFVDTYQTKMLFDVGATEWNPLMRYLIDLTGSWTVIISIKLILLILLGIIIVKLNKNKK